MPLITRMILLISCCPSRLSCRCFSRFSRLSYLISLVICPLILHAESGTADKLLLQANGQTILSYNAAYIPYHDKTKPYYGRSGFIHPVLTPKGKMVTEGFPKGHVHQHALMFAWTQSEIEGRKVDFWNSHKKKGIVEHDKTLIQEAGHIKVQLKHIDITGDKPEQVISEIWDIQKVDDDKYHVFDLTSTHNALKKIKLPKYHYGGMCIRGHGQWLKSDSFKMITNETSDRVKGNHTRPEWVAMYGNIDGKVDGNIDGNVDGNVCGIVAISHPSNFRHPQPVRLHPRMPYFCFAPMVTGDFELTPEKPYVSRYRFIAFDGELDKSEIEKRVKAWQAVE